MVLPLGDIIYQKDFNEASFKEALSSFKCNIEPDIEDFLLKTAINNEKQNISRTYLILEDSKEFKILGYFSLALKVFSIKNLSKTKKRKFGRSTRSENIPAFLIGQIARVDNSQKGFGKEILKEAFIHIKNAQKEIGGNLVYLDCKDELIKYYYKFGFKFLKKVGEYNQLYLGI